MQINIEQIKKDFPQLSDQNNHYLDAAATSLTPQSVLNAVVDYYTNSRANVHRGIFKEAIRATEQYEEVRKKAAAFIGATPEEIIFTSGATESSNMFVRMIDESFNFEEDQKEIVTTEMEHHGTLLPLQEFADRRLIPIHFIPAHGGELDYAKAAELITAKTGLVSAMLASNVTGMINDVRRIADIAHKHSAIMAVDATAAVGHIPIDVTALGADALYFSGHKMLGPTGVGVLWVKRDLLEQLDPVTFGGHMVNRVENGKAEWAEIPTRFEAGTKNIGGVIGLGAAIDYLNEVGVANIHKHTATLAFAAIHKLEQIPGVKVHSPCDPEKNIGIVAFSCDFAHPHDVAEILARDNVAVRAGHHCAMPFHAALNIPATTRASFHVYNTMEDVDALVENILKVKDIFTK